MVSKDEKVAEFIRGNAKFFGVGLVPLGVLIPIWLAHVQTDREMELKIQADRDKVMLLEERAKVNQIRIDSLENAARWNFDFDERGFRSASIRAAVISTIRAADNDIMDREEVIKYFDAFAERNGLKK